MPKKEENKKQETKKQGKEKKQKHFFKDFKAELKRVIWPTPKQLLNNTVAVITVVLITAAIVFVLDFVFESMNTYGIDKIKELVETVNEVESTNSVDENAVDTNSVDENTESDSNESNESVDETTDEGTNQTDENSVTEEDEANNEE